MDTHRFSQSNFVGEKKSRLIDDYQIIKQLGKGAFSETFLARHKISNCERCIKATRRKISENVSDLDPIFEEVQILKTLDHPNIMGVFEYYTDAQNVYIVTEYLSGGELFDRIVESKKLSEDVSKKSMMSILSALSYMHKHSIVHRDLKPENIMLDSRSDNANVKLIDFGTSKQMDNIAERLRGKLGTAYYIAPEVLKNNYDYKCDIWSCGVILYILLCGYPPFNAHSDEEIFRKIQKGNFIFPDDEWSKVSKEARLLVTRMLTYEPSKRPNADDLLKDPWFSTSTQLTAEKNTTTHALQNLRNFYSNSKLQKAVLIYFVNFFDIKEEKTRLLQAFKQFDKDHDGQLTRAELLEAYRKFSTNPLLEAETEKILKNLDFNNTAAIDFSEFLVANVNYHQALNKDRLAQIFSIIDKDRNGFLTSGELKDFLNLSGAEHDVFVKQMIAEVDKNKDGLVSFDEFEMMMREFTKKF